MGGPWERPGQVGPIPARSGSPRHMCARRVGSRPIGWRHANLPLNPRQRGLVSTGKVDHWTFNELALGVHFHNPPHARDSLRARGELLDTRIGWAGKMSAPCSVVPCSERYVRVIWFVSHVLHPTSPD